MSSEKSVKKRNTQKRLKSNSKANGGVEMVDFYKTMNSLLSSERQQLQETPYLGGGGDGPRSCTKLSDGEFGAGIKSFDGRSTRPVSRQMQKEFD